MSNLNFARILTILTFLLSTAALGLASTSPDRLWTPVNEDTIGRSAERSITPAAYKTFRLDKSAAKSLLATAPEEFSDQSRFTQTVITLPMPNGTFGRFRIEHSLVVEPGLLAKYPELSATYVARGIDDPTATVRLDFLPSGLHAMVLSTSGTLMIDPYAPGDTENYISYYKRDAPRTGNFACQFGEQEFLDSLLRPTDRSGELIPDAASPEVTSGTTLRTYRLAL